jgi:hypothetical protein
MPDNAAGKFVDELSNGDKVILGGSLVLLIAMFLPWKGVDLGIYGSATESGFHAWGLLTFIALLCVIALWLLRGPLRSQFKLPEWGVSDAMLYMILGAVEVVFILLFWVAFDTESVVGVRFGLFIALIGGLATIAGGYLKQSEPASVAPAGGGGGIGSPGGYGTPPPAAPPSAPPSYGAPPPAAPPSSTPPSAPPSGGTPPPPPPAV